MSVEQMSLVWKLDLAPNQKIVLLAYADHAHDDGSHVFPSLKRIAYKTGYSRDQVRRISRELKENGLMEQVADPTHNRPAEYKLTLERGSKLPPLEKRGVANDPSGVGANDPPQVGASMPPEPSENHQPEPSVTKEVVTNVPTSFGVAEKPPAPSKPVSAKNYGITRLMDRVKAAKAQGKQPSPPDEPYKRRHGDIYSAHLSDGYEVEDLDPALDYLVQVACGEGTGWLQDKKRWIPLVDAIAHVEAQQPTGRASPNDERHLRLVEENERTLQELLKDTAYG